MSKAFLKVTEALFFSPYNCNMYSINWPRIGFSRNSWELFFPWKFVKVIWGLTSFKIRFWQRKGECCLTAAWDIADFINARPSYILIVQRIWNLNERKHNSALLVEAPSLYQVSNISWHQKSCPCPLLGWSRE